MRLTSAAHRPSAESRTPKRIATVLLATIGASGPAQAQYQPDSSISTGGATLPGSPGYQVGGGLDVGAARRAGWWSETSITTQATLTNKDADHAALLKDAETKVNAVLAQVK